MLPSGLLYTLKVAMGMSIMYCIASLIPYFIGSKLKGLLLKKPNKGLDKAKNVFNRYGSWSVALLRPFGIGNYISYAAGMSNMELVRYLLFTFLGIYPWCFVILSLGKYFKGDYEGFVSFYYKNSVFFYGIAVLILITMICIYIVNRKKYIRYLRKEN